MSRRIFYKTILRDIIHFKIAHYILNFEFNYERCFMAERFDVIVLGGGPAGYSAANAAARRGLKTAIFEGHLLGGTCLNEGCIPSKSFIHSSKECEAFGGADLRKWVDEKTSATDMLRNGVRGSLRKNKVKIIFSFGTINSYSDGLTTMSDDKGAEYETENLIIATGSEVSMPPIEGISEALKSGFAVTTNEIFDRADDFQSIAIIGGGVIGIEIAGCFARAGKIVSIIEVSDKIGASLESDVSASLEKSLVESGVRVMKNTKATKIADGRVYLGSDGCDTFIESDLVLVCTGRKPRTSGLGIEKLTLNLERGAIVTDSHMFTGQKGVYAIGDVNGKSMLAHTAYREADVCINAICGEKDEMDYNSVPNVVYGVPEAVCVGESETDLLRCGGRAFVKKLPMTYSGRAVAEKSAKNGFCKLVFDENDVLRGAFMVGEYASEIALFLSVTISGRFTVEKMKKIIYPHPTVGEIIRETLYVSGVEAVAE